MITILENMNLYIQKYNKDECKRSFAHQGSTLKNGLSDEVKEFGSLYGFGTIVSSLDKDSPHI